MLKKCQIAGKNAFFKNTRLKTEISFMLFS